MALLSLTLAPEAVGKLHDVLVCLGKFSESVSLEANRDKLILSALNLSKSAYASFTFDGSRFFARYQFAASQATSSQARDGAQSHFTCQLYNKALISVFRGRLLDARDRETSVERCELRIQEGPQRAECRLIVKMICKHGVVKTCRLTYEAADVMHATFDRLSATSRWTISASALKDFSEHFGPKTEQLDIYPEGGRCIFNSYTEKIMNGREVLKQSLQTSVAVDTLEFDCFSVHEPLHVVISVKDFKAIVVHADGLGSNVTACYSHAMRPMQINYESQGVSCEFTLMTTGEPPSSCTASRSFAVQRTSLEPASRQGRAQGAATTGRVIARPLAAVARPPTRAMAPTAASEVRRRPSPPPPKASLDDRSLFFPEDEDDDDGRWNAYTSDHDGEDLLGWDASVNPSRNDTSTRPRELVRTASEQDVGQAGREDRIAPTQRISQVRGLFD